MAYEYLLTALPPLPDQPGSALPISAETLREMIKFEEHELSEFTEHLLRAIDVQNLEFFDLDKEHATRKATEPVEGIRDQKDLPAWMKQGLVATSDIVLDAYFKQLMAFLEERGAEELMEWFRWEIGLRNALVGHRARKIGIPPDPYYVAPDFGLKSIEYTSVFNDLKELDPQAEPFAEDRFIAQVMLGRLKSATPEYAFDFTEIIGYVIKFLILARVEYLSE
ncbi:MAG: hypothetical protein Q8P24_05370 [Desulfobacterales bacterium]|nr:hypothetical protein [Desulfobacterales bacterium]